MEGCSSGEADRLPSAILGHLAAAFLEGSEICSFRSTCKAWLAAADAAALAFWVTCSEPRLVDVLRRLPALRNLTMRDLNDTKDLQRMQATKDSSGGSCTGSSCVTGCGYGGVGIAEAVGCLPCPQGLRRLRILQSPDLSSLEGVEILSGLEELDCGGGPKELTSLAPPAGLKRLRKLRLKGGICMHGDQGLVAAAPSLAALTGLGELNLGSSRFGAEGAAALASALVALAGLTRLDLSEGVMEAEAVEILAPALISLKGGGGGTGAGGGLQDLLLNGNLLGDGVAKALAPAIRTLTGLRRLSLGGNRIGKEGVDALAPALGALTGLRELDLSDCDLRGGLEGGMHSALFPALSALMGLRLLCLTGGRVGARSAAALAPAIGLMGDSLHHLSLGANDLGPGGAAALAPVLGALTGLESLDLMWNNLDAAGTAALASSLRDLTLLRRLDLSWNEMGAEGAAALAPVLLNGLPSLRHLNLRSNQLGAEGAEILVPAIVERGGLSNRLQEVDLSNNMIGIVNEVMFSVMMKMRIGATGLTGLQVRT